MESTVHVSAEQPTGMLPPTEGPAATLFTAFGIGSSYIFHAEDGHTADACWEEIFEHHMVWEFGQLKEYKNPLGAVVTFAVGGESCCVPVQPIADLRRACEDKLAAELETRSIKVIFFTTGVAVLVLRLKPLGPGDATEFCEAVQDDGRLEDIRETLKSIIRSCKDHYLELMNKATEGERPRKLRWTLNKFSEVDRENWDPKLKYSFALFFVENDTYERRTLQLLGRVGGSQRRRLRQSDRARVSYQGAEVFVDWSEALVRDVGQSRERIENNFLIAFASWFALRLMNDNSSVFIFEAFVGMVTGKHRSNDEAVHKRSMAYIDVSDASLPIRWTTRRKDLFLLETIYRNWSFERWRKNIEERMKLLALHYNRLEDERRASEDERRALEDERRATEDERRKEEDRRRADEAERHARAGRRIAFVGLSLTSVTLASAIADVINLAENDGDGKASSWLFLGLPLKGVDFYLTSFFLWIGVIGIALVLAFWVRSRRRERKKQSDSQSPPPGEGRGSAAEPRRADSKTLPSEVVAVAQSETAPRRATCKSA